MSLSLQERRIKALYDFWEFLDLINFKGGRDNFGSIHHELGRFISKDVATPVQLVNGNAFGDVPDRNSRRLILMPRGHLKSTICSVGRVLHRIYRNPNIRIVVGCNVKELSWSFIRELRSYLEDPILQERVWNNRPHIKGPLIPELDRSGNRGKRFYRDETETVDKKVIWSSTSIQVNRSFKLKEPTVLATSVGSRITGGHYDEIILDDIVDFRNTATPELIAKTFEWAQDLESVLDPPQIQRCSNIGNIDFYDIVGDQVTVLGTRYAKGDYYEYLISNKEDLGYEVISHNIYANGKNADDGYLWPERFNASIVEKLRKRLTSKKFASQYLNTIIVSQDQVFNIDNIEYFNSEKVDIRANEVQIHVGERPYPMVRLFLTVDPAISDSRRADFTSVTVGGFDQHGKLWILEQHYGKFRPLDTAKLVGSLISKWKLRTCYVEQVGGFKAIAYTIKEYLKNNKIIASIQEFKPGQANKKTRIENYLEPYFTNKNFALAQRYKGDEEISNELQFFPSDIVHDDILDSWAMLVEIGKPPLTDAQKEMLKKPPARAFRNIRYGGTR